MRITKAEKERQADEVKLIVTYGLRNKREVWKSQSVLRRYRRAARDITAMTSAGADPKAVETKRRQLLESLDLNACHLLFRPLKLEDVTLVLS
jgi:small subunit ribosomal protein S4